MSRPSYIALSIVLWLGAAAGCGDDGGPEAPGVDASPVDSAPGLDTGTPMGCEAAAQALAEEMYEQAGQGCSAVVRLGYESRDVLGHWLVCGPYATPTEIQARQRAQSDTGFGADGQRLGPDNPEDAYVFHEPAGDFGGSAAVSADTGLSVFGGATVWAGVGEITYPGSWRPATELGASCPLVGEIAQTRGFDLGSGQPLDAADVDRAVAVVARTALPDAFWRGGYVFDALVLLYPRTVGAFDPESAEWIVVLNGGWLE